MSTALQSTKRIMKVRQLIGYGANDRLGSSNLLKEAALTKAITIINGKRKKKVFVSQ